MSIDLAKKHLIDLTKKATEVVQKVGLGDQKAKVAVAFDVSGSMSDRYRKGEVQEAVDRILALAVNFDDNRALDMFAFDTRGHSIGEISEENFYQFINKNVQPLVGGGTAYAPVMKMILASYGISIDGETAPQPVVKKRFGFFGKKEEAPAKTENNGPLDEPIFIIFVTDGENGDHQATEHVVREASKHGVFFKFVGIGNERFYFLDKLDNLTGRLIDNANFIKVNDIANINEEDLYADLLKEFPEWLVEARSNNLIK
jgi:hypothetical protein